MSQSQSSTFLGHAREMLATHPKRASAGAGVLLSCIEACFDCAQACVSCADACLGEPEPKGQVRCIRLNLDCAEICEATGKILSRQTAGDVAVARAIVQACQIACSSCADECERHAPHMEHCRVCADACRRCESACMAFLQGAPTA